MSEFGGLIRQSRELLGLSQTRVAELVGRAPGTFRAWERGSAVPNDPIVVTSLAAVLGIDEVQLFEAAGLTPPSVRPVSTIEESLASIAPGGWSVDHPSSVDRRSSDQARPSPRPAERATPRRTVEESRTETIAAPPPVVRPVITRPAEPMGPTSYLEDPEQRLLYRMRAGLTAAGVVLLFVVLVWAAGQAWDALGESLDRLFAGL